MNSAIIDTSKIKGKVIKVLKGYAQNQYDANKNEESETYVGYSKYATLSKWGCFEHNLYEASKNSQLLEQLKKSDHKQRLTSILQQVRDGVLQVVGQTRCVQEMKVAFMLVRSMKVEPF